MAGEIEIGVGFSAITTGPATITAPGRFTSTPKGALTTFVEQTGAGLTSTGATVQSQMHVGITDGTFNSSMDWCVQSNRTAFNLTGASYQTSRLAATSSGLPGSGRAAQIMLSQMIADGIELSFDFGSFSSDVMAAFMIGGSDVQIYAAQLTVPGQSQGGIQTWFDPGFEADIVFVSHNREGATPSFSTAGPQTYSHGIAVHRDDGDGLKQACWGRSSPANQIPPGGSYYMRIDDDAVIQFLTGTPPNGSTQRAGINTMRGGVSGTEVLIEQVTGFATGYGTPAHVLAIGLGGSNRAKFVTFQRPTTPGAYDIDIPWPRALGGIMLTTGLPTLGVSHGTGLNSEIDYQGFLLLDNDPNDISMGKVSQYGFAQPYDHGRYQSASVDVSSWDPGTVDTVQDQHIGTVDWNVANKVRFNYTTAVNAYSQTPPNHFQGFGFLIEDLDGAVQPPSANRIVSIV